MDASEATRRYRALRGRHRIIGIPGPVPGVRLCQVDGVKVYPIKGGNLRHDRGDIGALVAKTQLTSRDARLGRSK